MKDRHALRSRIAQLAPSLAPVMILAVVGWISGLAVDSGVRSALALPDDARVLVPDWSPDADGGEDGGDARRPDTAMASTRGLDRSRPPSRSAMVRPIVERSMFDSSKVGKGEDAEEVEDGEILSDLELILLATVVAVPSDYSSALIAKEGERKVRRKRGRRGKKRSTRVIDNGIDQATGFGIGDEVFGKATLVAIEPGKVVLERDGQREILLIGSPEDEEPVKRTASAGSDKDEDDGVEKIARDHYAVDREVIDRLAANPAALNRLGRATPHKTDGSIDGYRLSRIRRNSLGRKMGLRSGDVVHSVSGYGLTSISEAMQAFDSLQSSSELTVDITRRGKKRQLTVEIR